MLGVPPRVAQADGRCQDACEPIVAWPEAKNLAVRSLVGQEGRLRKNETEGRRDEQLKPGNAEKKETRQTAAESRDETRRYAPIEPRRSFQQATFSGLGSYVKVTGGVPAEGGLVRVEGTASRIGWGRRGGSNRYGVVL